MRRPDPTLNPDVLRAARERQGLTQHQLARLVGVAGGERISRWELGMSTPRPRMLIRLADVLEVAPAALLTPDHGPADLRRMRVLAGLSAREFARRMHMSVANIQRWEAGRIERIPPAQVLERVAAAMSAEITDVERGFIRSRDLYRQDWGGGRA